MGCPGPSKVHEQMSWAFWYLGELLSDVFGNIINVKIWHNLIWPILVSKWPPRPKQSHTFIRFWLNNWNFFPFINFENPFWFLAKLRVHSYLSKWPWIKKVVSQNVSKIKLYIQIHMRQNSRCKISFSQ